MRTARALPRCKRLSWGLIGLSIASALAPVSFSPAAGAAEPLDGPLQARDQTSSDLLGGKNGARYRFRGAEKCFMRRVNRVRAAHGQRRLNWDKQLGYVARRHARVLANHGGVWHDQNLGRRVTRWRSLGQNTGAGGRCRRLFRSFMDSPPHRANILGRFRFMGVGTKRSGKRLYVQQIFEFRRNPGNVWSWP
jgi:uncharacterized protein YkwD